MYVQVTEPYYARKTALTTVKRAEELLKRRRDMCRIPLADRSAVYRLLQQKSKEALRNRLRVKDEAYGKASHDHKTDRQTDRQRFIIVRMI